MTSFNLSFPEAAAAMSHKKRFIRGPDTYSTSVKKLKSHSSDKALVPEGVVKRCCVIPSLHLDLMTVRDTGNGAG